MTPLFALVCIALPAKIVESPMSRGHHAAVYDPNAKVFLVYGGVHIEGDYPNMQMTRLSDVWAFDGKGWKRLADTGECRISAGFAYDTKRKAPALFGGARPNGGPLSGLQLLKNAAWLPVSDDPLVSRADAGFVYDGDRDRYIVCGGWNVRDTAFGDTWEFSPAGWKRSTAVGPPARLSHGMVYDSTRKLTILYGGMSCPPNQSIFADTWEYDGRTWKQVPAHGPKARTNFGMAYDAKRGRTILFGGLGADMKPAGDTWAYDGKAWTKLTDSGPSPRSMPALGYDSFRDRVVLFGGRDDRAKELGDTWEFDGEKWTRFGG